MEKFKERIVIKNIDMFLTPEEERRLEKSLVEHKKGKTIKLDDFRR